MPTVKCTGDDTCPLCQTLPNRKFQRSWDALRDNPSAENLQYVKASFEVLDLADDNALYIEQDEDNGTFLIEWRQGDKIDTISTLDDGKQDCSCEECMKQYEEEMSEDNVMFDCDFFGEYFGIGNHDSAYLKEPTEEQKITLEEMKKIAQEHKIEVFMIGPESQSVNVRIAPPYPEETPDLPFTLWKSYDEAAPLQVAILKSRSAAESDRIIDVQTL